MVQARHHRFSFAEYVELEEGSGVKHEYLDGQVYAMSGGSPEHAGVTANVTRLLGNALEGQPCRVFSPDLRVRAQSSGLGTYADVTVVCGRLLFDPEDPKQHTVLNPTVLVEVLSPSTEDYDRGEKLGHYKGMASVREVVFVAIDRHEIEVVRREQDGTWSRHVSQGGESVHLTSIDRDLAVDRVYWDPLVVTE